MRFILDKKEIDRLRKLIRKIESQDNSRHTTKKEMKRVELKGKEITNSAGSFLLIEHEYPLSDIHGNTVFKEFFEIKNKYLALIGKEERFKDIGLNEIAFIDTESTGLSGTGIYLFLIGIGYFQKDKYILRQYFMRDFDEEEPMLIEIDKFLDKFDAFVSFNGKTFDIPNIEMRLILTRIMKDIRNIPHLDLLHPARRLWKQHLDAFNLTNLERNLLSFYREDDVPSEQIPQIYFDYVRHRNPTMINKVIEHNAYDIISMVGILVKEVEVVSNYLSQPYDILFNAGRFYEKNLKLRTAVEIFSKLFEAEDSCEKEFFIKGSCRLAFLYKKLKLHDDSIEIWERLKPYSKYFGPDAFLELAKFYEHNKKDIEKALEVVKSGLNFCKNNYTYSSFLPDFENRLNRLENKLVKT